MSEQRRETVEKVTVGDVVLRLLSDGTYRIGVLNRGKAIRVTSLYPAGGKSPNLSFELFDTGSYSERRATRREAEELRRAVLNARGSDMRICENCGSEVPAHDPVCQACGHVEDDGFEP